MSDLWFDPKYLGLIGGVFGTIAGCWGSLCGILGSKGKGFKFILYSAYCLIAVSLVFLSLGISAYFLKQPRIIWYSLILIGLVGTIVFSVNIPMIKKRYADTELNKSIMKDLE